MQKITLKPTFQELIFKTNDPTIACDVFSYSGTSNQEKSLGSLFLITHASFDDQEDMSYVVSLISSLAKREFYSTNAVKAQDSKIAFERTLKKLNEVLEDFFDNKALKLNIGLVAMQDNEVYISKLGKFKVALARDGQYIDVLNNVALFEKSIEKQEEQFSNVISGTLKPGDRLFAYFPARAITSREKRLNKIFVANTREAFINDLEQTAQTAKNFSCCGIYTTIDEVKEIPLESKPSYSVMSGNTVKANKSKSVDIEEDDEELIDIPSKSTHGVSAEMSMGQRSNWMTSLKDNISRARNIHSFQTGKKIQFFAIIAAIIIIPIIIIILATGGPSEMEIARDNAQLQLDQAKELIAQGNEKQARALLSSTLEDIKDIDDKEIEMIRININDTLNTVNRISDISPTFIATYEGDATPLTHIAHSENDIHLVGHAGDMVYLKSDATFKNTESFSGTPLELFGTDERISFVTNDGDLAVLNLVNTNTGRFTLDVLSSDVIDYELFADNLYALTDSTIYRYANANTGSNTYDQWLDNVLTTTPLDMAIDGNIYVLTTDGMVEVYFRGALDSKFDTGLNISSKATIHSAEDGANLYILDKDLLYIFAKDSTNLKITYNVGDIDDLTVLNDGTIWILKDNQVFTLIHS